MKKLWTLLLTLVFVVGSISPTMITTAYGESGVVMTVNGTPYTDHATGWSAALELADDDINTTVKLFADWVAPNGYFEGESGTDNGSLHIDGSNYVLIIDLNGHKIDRNLSSPVDDGCGRVFHVQNVKKLTICDTKGGGLITGANNAGGIYGGRGGAFLIEDGEIVFDNITIAGNKAQSEGGAMYVWYDDTTVEIKNCIIRDNEANTGGGIFAYDDVAMTIRDTTICNNIGLGHGGGICWKSEGPLNLIKNVNICHNEARGENSAGGNGGAIYASTVMVDMFKYMGGSVVVYDDSVKIFENKAKFGAGISWASTGDLILLGGVITGNIASECGGGVIMHKDIGYVGGHMQHFGDLYLGGTVKVLGNTTGDVADNVYIEGVLGKLRHASDMSVEAYNVPLSEGACIGVGGPEELLINTGLTNGEAKFNMESYQYFFADNDDYYLRPVYNKNSDDNKYKFVYTARDSDIYEATKIDITEYNEELLTGVSVDNEENIITLTGRNNKKHTFESFTLDFLFEYDRDVFNIQNIERACNFLKPQKYVIYGQNGTYEIFTVQVVPEGGEWSDFQDEPIEYFYAHVSAGDKLAKFKSCEEGWAYAIQQASEGIPVTFKLMNDWVKEKGDFIGGGTELGYLYLNDEDIDLTIELNGYTIDRDLDTAKENGQVFKIDNGKLTITDSVGTGKITGGNTTGKGGAFWVEYGTLCIKGGEISGNKAQYGGAVYCDDIDDAFIYIEGGKFVGNTATEDGGAIYVYNGYLDMKGGEIRDNDAANGAGIYWNSDNACYLTGGKIMGNHASNKGGGVYVSSNGDVYLGGDVQITENYYGNLYLVDKAANISNAKGQNGAPNKPLTEGAKICISSANIEEEISASNSMFAEGDFRFLYSDYDRYFIRSVYDANGGNHAHKLYINTWAHADARYPRVKTVSVKDSNLLEDVVFDYDTQTITLVAHNTRRNFFERAVLSDLIECTYDKDTYYLYKMDYMSDLRNPHEYKIMSDNGTYVICKVNVVPEGGAWSDVQESVDNPYKMLVEMGGSSRGFNNFDEGWTYAVSQSNPVTITLFADWTAENGEFDYSNGTKGGALYIDGKDITIDLNGNTINRGLTESESDGHVFWLVGGAKLTINDTSDANSGKITGAYGSGDGGAFYVDYAKLYINGGEISGNQAKNGAAIYSTNEDDSYIYINGGKFTGNTATGNGGAIFMEEGYLYLDGGEISGNTAVNGGGIYWNSENKFCLTGGKITDNRANDGAGVYAADWGDIYVGGTIFIKDNIMIGTADQNNFILSDTDVYLNNAAGQTEVPNKPLTDGAYIGIRGKEADTLISGSDSRFEVDSAKYFKADRDMYCVYGWYKANGGSNTYQLYYNFDAIGSELPCIKSVESKSDLVQASLNSDSWTITLTANMNVKKLGTLESAKLSELIKVTFSKSDAKIMNFDANCDYTVPQKIMVIDSETRYSVYTVKVEWICSEHTDKDGDYVCDDCKEYTFSKATIVDYNAQTQEATVFVPQAGRYSLVFTDYETDYLEFVNIVEYDFKEGINIVPQGVTNFTLTSGDKVLLWYDMINLVPVCEALTIK